MQGFELITRAELILEAAEQFAADPVFDHADWTSLDDSTLSPSDQTTLQETVEQMHGALFRRNHAWDEIQTILAPLLGRVHQPEYLVTYNGLEYPWPNTSFDYGRRELSARLLRDDPAGELDEFAEYIQEDLRVMIAFGERRRDDLYAALQQAREARSTFELLRSRSSGE